MFSDFSLRLLDLFCSGSDHPWALHACGFLHWFYERSRTEQHKPTRDSCNRMTKLAITSGRKRDKIWQPKPKVAGLVLLAALAFADGSRAGFSAVGFKCFGHGFLFLALTELNW